MKRLIINSLRFRLPENFTGTLSDALQLLTNYRREREVKLKSYTTKDHNIGYRTYDATEIYHISYDMVVWDEEKGCLVPYFTDV